MKRRADARSRYENYVKARTKACATCPDDAPVVYLPPKERRWCPLPCGKHAECCVLSAGKTSDETLNNLSDEALLDLHEHYPELDTLPIAIARGIEDKHMPIRAKNVEMFTRDDIPNAAQTLINMHSVEDFVRDVVESMYPDLFKYGTQQSSEVGLLLHIALRRDPRSHEEALVELLRLLRHEHEVLRKRTTLPYADHMYENVWIRGITSGLRAVAKAYPDVPAFQAAPRLWDDIVRANARAQ